MAVDIYIDHKISNIAALVEDEALGCQVRDQMRGKANGTFIWVALIFQELERAQSWDILKCLRTDYGLFVNSTAIVLAPIPQYIHSFRSALFIEEEWIIRDGKRFLLLPTDYQPHRPGSQAVTNNLIVLGHNSGGVTFIYFDLSS